MSDAGVCAGIFGGRNNSPYQTPAGILMPRSECTWPFAALCRSCCQALLQACSFAASRRRHASGTAGMQDEWPQGAALAPSNPKAEAASEEQLGPR